MTNRGGVMAGFAVLLLSASGMVAAEKEFTETFPFDDCTFSDTGRNGYFSLNPGDRLVLSGNEGGEVVRVQITVLTARQVIRFQAEDGETLSVRTRVIEEREWKDGELVEVSRNFFARCRETNDVYYFGEDVDIYEDGRIVSHDGAWRAGVDGNTPGLMMPGTFLLGSRYFQEVAPEIALDRAEHIEAGLTVKVPAGTFEDCVEIEETTPLEPGSRGTKIYCEELGLVVDADAQLVEFRIAGWDADDGDEARGTRVRTPMPR